MTPSPFRFGDLVRFVIDDVTLVGEVRSPDPDFVSVQVGHQWYYFGDSPLADGRPISELQVVTV